MKFSFHRIAGLLRCDILFQFRYGFYFLYAFFILFYTCMISVFPVYIHSKAASILVFTDPAAMGLFFMGSIILFEKSQRVIESLSISPVRYSEYITSKALSFAAISLASALAIALSVYLSGSAFFQSILHVVLFCASILLSSVLFTLIALGCASRSKTLNQFMIFTVPFEVLLMIPPVLLIFGISNPLLEIHPGIIALRLILCDSYFNPFISILLLLFSNICAYVFAFSSVKKMMVSWGGIKL